MSSFVILHSTYVVPLIRGPLISPTESESDYLYMLVERAGMVCHCPDNKKKSDKSALHMDQQQISVH